MDQCVVEDPAATTIVLQVHMIASLETLAICAGALMVHLSEEEDLEDQEERQDSPIMLAWGLPLSAQEKLYKAGV